ncbi:MAG: TetR/AcrR family transcriptional regulator [Caldilineales bacterium]
MTRTVKEPDIRRAEILDAAQQLFYAKGYEHTSVQDIIDQVGIAKGTFYHYFGSKIELLDCLVEQLADQGIALMEPIASSPDLDATTKFLRIFDVIAAWKTQSKAFMLDILRPLYSDDNTLLRRKLTAASLARAMPLFTCIIRQGVDEGSFRTDFPDEIGEIVMQVMTAFSEGLVYLLIQENPNGDASSVAARRLMVSQDAIERLLGAAPGSLPFMEIEDLDPWFE